jgi:hypothetical protein
MAKNAFDVFIPMSTESNARKEIIFDFFDLLAAISARGKGNGLGGRKLSRYAGWWAFEHSDDGKGFDGGYRSWAKAADATSHLFFAYLRALAPSPESGVSGISKLPRSLQALLSQTEYPPETPTLMQSTTTKVVMIVESVSPTPFSLLRRARNFEYRDDDRALQDFSNFDDPVEALTDECRRVLDSISSTNESAAAMHTNGTKGQQDPSWAMFEDKGFSSIADTVHSGPGDLAVSTNTSGILSGPGSRIDNLGRPTTPSWADFLSTGFPDDRRPALLPPDKQLPLPVAPRGHSSQSHVRNGLHADLEPGELASITRFDLDETFWWTWITSLAGEETDERKAAFGRCALIETHIPGASWLLIEEQIKGASPGQDEGVYLAEKKSRFSFTRRGRLGRRKTTVKKKDLAVELLDREKTSTPTSKIGPEQQAKLHQAATQLARGQQPKGVESSIQRRSRLDDAVSQKTNSVLTIGPTILTEAGPALKWTRNFDNGGSKEQLRAAYLGDRTAGRGQHSDYTGQSTSMLDLPSNGHTTPIQSTLSNRDLPAIPKEEDTVMKQPMVARAHTPPATPPYASTEREIASYAQVTTPPLIGDEKPKVADHPALRAEDSPESARTNSPVQTRTSPKDQKDHHPRKLQKSQPAPSGIKKFFGRKKGGPVENQAEKEKAPAPAAKGQRAPSRPLISGPVPAAAPAEPAYDSPPRSLKNEEPTYNEPIFEDVAATSTTARDEARREALERLEADQEFARFDQGPLEDVPAFVPDDAAEPSDAAPSPSIPTSRYVSIDEEPKPKHKPLAPIPAAADDSEDEDELNDAAPAPTVTTTSDRWAQIRKNAAERAQRMNTDQQHGRNHSQSNRSDDGETSGEETIESRVARIKARVAELTGTSLLKQHDS